MTERELGERLGFAKTRMLALRKTLQEGTHWTRTGTGTVEYTPAGIAAAAQHLGITEQQAGEIAAGKGEEKTAEHEQKTATVTSAFRTWQNPRLVSGTVDGKPVRIRVRDRNAFAPGMTVEVTEIGPGLYECRRAPTRRPGTFVMLTSRG